MLQVEVHKPSTLLTLADVEAVEPTVGQWRPPEENGQRYMSGLGFKVQGTHLMNVGP